MLHTFFSPKNSRHFYGNQAFDILICIIDSTNHLKRGNHGCQSVILCQVIGVIIS